MRNRHSGDFCGKRRPSPIRVAWVAALILSFPAQASAWTDPKCGYERASPCQAYNTDYWRGGFVYEFFGACDRGLEVRYKPCSWWQPCWKCLGDKRRQSVAGEVQQSWAYRAYTSQRELARNEPINPKSKYFSSYAASGRASRMLSILHCVAGAAAIRSCWRPLGAASFAGMFKIS
jgi:hypothetical protein